MSPEVEAAVIAGGVGILTVLGSFFGIRKTSRDTKDGLNQQLIEQREALDKTLQAQSDQLEETRTRTLNERFASAAGQLGSDNSAVRLAGVYAMAGLADDWRVNRQTCIDVLCAYLRMPYGPSPGSEAPATESLAFEANREVRRTVIRVITAHLKDDASRSWQDCKLDFTGVVFDCGDFADANFSGGEVSFRLAEFSGGKIRFDGAAFSGSTVDFDGAKFSGGEVSLRKARFSGGTVAFTFAEFSGGIVDFSEAKFSGSTADFYHAKFCGGMVDFDHAEFSGGMVNFTGAEFSNGTARFTFAEFSGGADGRKFRFDGKEFGAGTVSFDGAKFSGGTVDFHYANFSGDVLFAGAQFLDAVNADVSACTVTFEGATFCKGKVSFTLSRFAGGDVSFHGARFSGGVVTFMSAHFSASSVDFRQAKFTAPMVNFPSATFAGGVIDFSCPGSWDVPPNFPWPSERAPPCVNLPPNRDQHPL